MGRAHEAAHRAVLALWQRRKVANHTATLKAFAQKCTVLSYGCSSKSQGQAWYPYGGWCDSPTVGPSGAAATMMNSLLERQSENGSQEQPNVCEKGPHTPRGAGPQ